jgi:hypothetical protein
LVLGAGFAELSSFTCQVRFSAIDLTDLKKIWISPELSAIPELGASLWNAIRRTRVLADFHGVYPIVLTKGFQRKSLMSKRET